MFKVKTFWITLYLLAFSIHGLLFIHVFSEGSRIDQAIITMSMGLLVIWGVVIAYIQVKLLKKLNEYTLTPRKYILYFFLLCVLLALLAEIISTSMTNTAYLWGLSPHEAFITASPNYFIVVTQYSVIVFLPQFLVIALLNLRYDFKALHWFIIYGLIGYLGELLAFGSAASYLSIPFWMIIYGWIVYLPNKLLKPNNERVIVNPKQLVLGLVTPLIVSVPWVLFLLYVFH
ncbi:MAG: hypothetical protein ACNA7U_03750 [Candidatus Izemoplasmataceae bacterium]